jgi:hypothetical protein
MLLVMRMAGQAQRRRARLHQRSDLAKAGKGVTVGFCEDFWQWIYDSEEVDPASGDPIPRELA